MKESVKRTLIIENVQKYNTPDNPQQDGDLRNRIGEMYFMRGYFHMLLLRMYGEAPYIDRVINAGDNMDFKKESVHSMVEKIVTDAQTAYGMVPNKYVKTSENFGRVDKGSLFGIDFFCSLGSGYSVVEWCFSIWIQLASCV